MIGAALLMLLVSSCRETNDVLLPYDHNDVLAFGAAEYSFAGKFKVTWNGLNQYYALWDYEKEQGLDWDAVYDEYLPQFEALDEREDSIPVTDDEVKELLNKVLSPLHDGHFAMLWKNHVTGNNVVCVPSSIRNASRDDAEIVKKYKPNISYYTNPANGEIETSDGQPVCLEYSTLWTDLVDRFRNTPGQGMMWIEDRLLQLMNQPLPTEMEIFQRRSLSDLSTQLLEVLSQPNAEQGIPAFNSLVERYSYLEVPGFDVIDNAFIKMAISVKFALLKGNIAYFYFSDFSLTPYINEVYAQSIFNLNNAATFNHVYGIWRVWNSWFETIQQLHKEGTLGGVIIDVRGNGGGMMSDAQFVAGALLPSGGFQYGYNRFKRGTGRYDYSPLMPAIALTMEDEHEIVDDKPVVLLINSGSVSMAEMTAQVVRLMPNGKLIGKRSHGGLCGLVDNEYNSTNYAGHIGIRDVTPVYGYVPSLASFTMDKEQLEGVGISPGIEVAFDENAFNTPTGIGRDTQLDRALQYVRTGN